MNESQEYVKQIRDIHSRNLTSREARIKRMRAYYQLEDELELERKCKNEAYYFIMENNLVDDFANYCEQKKRPHE